MVDEPARRKSTCWQPERRELTERNQMLPEPDYVLNPKNGFLRLVRRIFLYLNIKHRHGVHSTRLALSFVLLAVSMAACTRQNATSFTESQLKEVLAAGKQRKAVEKDLGKPFLTMSEEAGLVVAYHTLPTPSVAFEGRLTGFQVHYTNNRVERWFPVYSDQSISASPGRSGLSNSRHPAGDSLPKLGLYAVSEVKLPHGVYMNTSAFPDLGYVNERPDLEFVRLQSVRTQDHTGGSGTIPGALIIFARDDTGRLAEFTEDNIGKRVLIKCGDDVISCPYIREPVKNGTVSIRFPNAGERNQAVTLLGTLVVPE
jgi:hypothetical protein